MKNVNDLSIVELKALLFDMQNEIHQTQVNAKAVLSILENKIKEEAEKKKEELK